MDFTMAVGGIQSTDDDTISKDEEMTMEFTSVVGGVFAQGNSSPASRRKSAIPQSQKQSRQNRQSLDSAIDDDTMDITGVIGGIMPQDFESVADEADMTVGMDLTRAVGGILPQLSSATRMQAKNVMELEVDLESSPFRTEVVADSPMAPTAVHTIASETGSPSMMAFRGKGLRRSVDAQHSAMSKPMLGEGTPIKRPTTPSTQVTPQPARPRTPSKTPPSKNIAMRTSSPKRLFKNEIKASSSTSTPLSVSKKRTTPNKLFQNDKSTGAPTPNFVLTPQQRRSSGLGIDRVGLGSPRVAELLDRRGSIGEQAVSFVPSQLGRGVRFGDPRELEKELNAEYQSDEADDKDVTINLKEMIESMTPKKKPLKGRKSLHVGAARGILGKRPIELDEDEDEEENDGVKRLKGHQGSPVKNVKLQAPPSKEDTTGRPARSTRRSFEHPSGTQMTASSPLKDNITTPRSYRRSRDEEATMTLTGVVPSLTSEDAGADDSLGDDRIQLQDFLNMTSIRFMELTTTKRRHTIAPREQNQRESLQDGGSASLEDCVAAGAATVPMLELFQHVSPRVKSHCIWVMLT